MNRTQVTIAPLKKEDMLAVRELLVAGLTERWGVYDPGFNPDIEAFPEIYREATVLVAKHEGVIVGTGTLKPTGTAKAEIVRMSVACAARRMGIGTAILEHLLQRARDYGVAEVALETTSSWSSAVAFYTAHGFVQTHERDGDTHFLFKLGEA